MKYQTIAAAAYVPDPIHNIYSNKMSESLREEGGLYRLLSQPFNTTQDDVNGYIGKLYQRVAAELRKVDRDGKRTRHDLMTDIKLVLLYVDGDEEGREAVFNEFGVEALVTPIKLPTDTGYLTPNDRNRSANFLVDESIQALRHAQALFESIEYHVQKIDSKTPMLLPVKNFGADIGKVLTGMREAAAARGEDDKRFRRRIERIERALPTARQGGRRYFRGRSGIVFRGTPKGGPRHGVSPGWSDRGHNFSCVIRGRLRFGVPYDPRFHYDCDISKIGNREFPSCHGTEKIKAGQRHVNIAPNDNIR